MLSVKMIKITTKNVEMAYWVKHSIVIQHILSRERFFSTRFKARPPEILIDSQIEKKKIEISLYVFIWKFDFKV